MKGLESTIAHEALRFVRKDPSKLKLVLGLYALSAKDHELGKVTRASYFFVRHLDDLLDGEMEIVQDPLEYALDLRDQIETHRIRQNSKIARLGGFAIESLEKRSRPEDNPRGDFVRAIDALIFDYHRRLDRRVLSSEQLQTYYSEVLDPGLNLMLIGFDSSMRANDIPAFSPNLGRLYSLRDLEKDWELGFINIPKSVLQTASLTSHSSFEQVSHNEIINHWTGYEKEAASQNLFDFGQQINTLEEPFTRKVLDGLVNQAVKSVATF